MLMRVTITQRGHITLLVRVTITQRGHITLC
jgi:hypothetical protein